MYLQILDVYIKACQGFLWMSHSSRVFVFSIKYYLESDARWHILTLNTSIPQNGQTHSSVFDHFVGLVLEGLMRMKRVSNTSAKMFKRKFVL